MAETKESGAAVEESDRRRESEDDATETEEKKKLGESCGPSQLSDSIMESEPKSPLTKVESFSGEAIPEISTENHFSGLGMLTVIESSGGAESKELVAETHQEACTEVETQDQMQSPVSPTPIARCLPQAISDASISSITKTPSSDGYNWRKYGQKQVKSPRGSRSYYRCTSFDCSAKKIECSNDLGCVVEVVNRGVHSHDPPRRNNSVRESGLGSSLALVSTDPARVEPIRVLRDSDASTSAKEPIHDLAIVPERKRHDLSGYDGNHLGEPEPKRRLKKDNSTCSDSKTEKKQKFVVHAAGDVGISGDGYRWRKYGQKMVKGNPNPRNYYRCTSAGCAARKHIERAVDNTTAVLITYKGGHDHDMPVPKKRHGPPSALLIAAAAPSSKNNTQTKDIRTVEVQPQNTTNQQAAGREGEFAGEKTLESARTLLGIGFEIKQC